MGEKWRDTPKKAYKPRDPEVTSAMMSKVKNRDSKAEMKLRREMWSRGWRYRLHSKKLIGKPDLVFQRSRLVVFVDGDFWHGRALIEEGQEGLKRGLRTDRSDWWLSKIGKNVERDKFVTRNLVSDGWRVLRFWESNVHRDVSAIADEIEKHLRT